MNIKINTKEKLTYYIEYVQMIDAEYSKKHEEFEVERSNIIKELQDELEEINNEPEANDTELYKIKLKEEINSRKVFVCKVLGSIRKRA